MSRLPENLTQKIRKAVQPEELLRKINYRPETIQRAGQTVKSFCPIHRDPIFRTLVIDADAWSYRCTNKQCPGKDGGDLIDLYARSRAVTYEEALLEMAKLFGIEMDPNVIADFVKEALEVGDNYLAMGVFNEAEQQYDRVLLIQPASLPALRGLVRLYQETGKAAKLTHTQVRLAKVLVETGQHQEAATLLRDYAHYNPDDTPTRLLYIQCLEKLNLKDDVAREYLALADSKASTGDIDEALNLYRRVEAMGLDSVDVSAQITQTLISAGRQDEVVVEMIRKAENLLGGGKALEAIARLQSALELDPTRDDLRVKVAGIIAGEKLSGEPLADFCKALAVMIRGQVHGPAAQSLDLLMAAFPDHAGLAELKGDLEEARGFDEAAVEMRLHAAELYERKKEFAKALEIANKALRLAPDQLPLMSRKAELLRRLKRNDEAAEAYLAIIAQFKASDNFEQAAAAYQAVIDLQPDQIAHRQKQFELYLRSNQKDVIIAKSLELAEAYRARNERKEAARALERVLETAPDNPDLLTSHAEILEEMGRKGEAAEQFLSAAKHYMEQTQYDAARNRLDRSLKCLPEHMESRELKADVLAEQKLIPQAIHEYNELAQFYLRAREPHHVVRLAKKVLGLEPEHLGAIQLLVAGYGAMGQKEEQRASQMKLVEIYRRQQSFTPASTLCEEILGEDEDYTPALEQLVAIAVSTRQSENSLRHLWKLAQVYARSGRRVEELRVLGDILERDPFHAEAVHRRLELLAQWGDPQELATATEKAIQQFNGAGRLEEVGRILEDLRHGAAPKPEILSALVTLRRLAGDQVGIKDALRAQAQLLARALRDDEAIKVLGELAELLPEDLSIRRSRIELMLRSERQPEAAEEYRFLAKTYTKQNQWEAAESACLEVLKLLPEDGPIQESLIALYLRQGKIAEASRAIEALAAQEIKNGRFDAAVAAYERFLAAEPQSEETYQKIIAIEQRAGNVAGALGHFNRLLDLFAEQGRSGAFEQAAHDAMNLDTANWQIRKRLADHLVKSGRLSEAEGTLREMASLQIKSGLNDAAAETVEQMLQINKTSVQGLALRAQLLALQGKTDTALTEFMQLAGNLSEMRGSIVGQPATPFAFGNYEGMTRVKEYTFDQFVVGSRNNFAHATALAVSRAPGKNYNPLFLYADVGLGKTHLCHAIANYVLEHHPNLKVMYTMTEDFIGVLIDSIQNNTITAFRNRYRQCDVLIIDDIQFISGKERAQEEFFHIFNALFQGGKQIVITSDRPPKEIAQLEKRLRSRFGAGIIVDIQSPDLETRIAIIRRELIQRGRNQEVSDESVFLIAESIPSNIRDLKGAITQVLARHDATKEPIDSRLIQQVVDKVMDRV